MLGLICTAMRPANHPGGCPDPGPCEAHARRSVHRAGGDSTRRCRCWSRTDVCTHGDAGTGRQRAHERGTRDGGHRDGGAARCAGGAASGSCCVLWLIVLVAVAPLAQKLTDAAEERRVDAGCPGSAESTQGPRISRRSSCPSTAPAVVVYARPGGLTAADRATIGRDTGAMQAP